MKNLFQFLSLVLLAGTICFEGCAAPVGPEYDGVKRGVATKPGMAQSKKLVSVIHKGKRILVSENAVQAHLAHGDELPFTGIAQLPGGAEMDFVHIPPGTFLMGSPENEPYPVALEMPQHQVTITNGFYLSKYEITQEQWESVMGTTPWSGQSYVKSGPDYPAVYVSWYDAQAFVDALNTAAGQSLYRLPTEAEWEYACRAGTITRWSFGDDASLLGDYAWYDENTWNIGEQYAHSVGQKLANPWGLYDMHGNVSEWCQDWLEPYASEAQEDPVGPPDGVKRTYRGGILLADPNGTRSAVRDGDIPSFTYRAVGFRALRRVQFEK